MLSLPKSVFGIVWGAKAKPPVLLHFPRRLCCDVHGSEMIQGDGHEKEFDPWRSRSSCSQINMEGKCFNPAHSAANRFSCSHLNADTTGGRLEDLPAHRFAFAHSIFFHVAAHISLVAAAATFLAWRAGQTSKNK